MNSQIASNILFPAYHKLRGTGVLGRVAELSQNESIPYEALLDIQRDKVRRLLQHAFHTVPFYTHSMKASGIGESDLNDPDVIQRLPLLTKKEINSNREKLISTKFRQVKMARASTSGSTGEALYFFKDRNVLQAHHAASLRFLKWLNIGPGDKTAILWGARFDAKKFSGVVASVKRFFNNRYFLSSYEMTEANMQRYCKRLGRLKPALVVSYPGPLTALAEFAVKNTVALPAPKAIVCSAETLFPWQRSIIEQAFGCKVYNRYGCREFGNIAQECAKREGLHTAIDRVLFEILDPDGRPVNAGETGELVITDLDNYGMPFIRYRIGDMGAWKSGKCSCGSSLPLLETIEGRVLDVVEAPNGNRLGGTFWTLLFRNRPGIKTFQVLQKDRQGVEVLFVRDDIADEPPLRYFENQIKEKCGSEFQVRFKEVSEIPLTGSGKRRFVKSELAACQAQQYT